MTDDELREWAAAHAPVGSTLAVAVLRVLAERDDLRDDVKAWKELEMAEFPRRVEQRERFEARIRALETELADARRVCESLAERCAGQAELIAARAGKEGGAVAAERERCARVAEEMFPVPDDGAVPRGSVLLHSMQAAHRIADRIREDT